MRYEKRVLELLGKNIELIVLAVILLFSVYLRYKYTPLIDITNGGSDYKSELLPWIEYFRQYGVREGLATGKGDYYVPYNLMLAFASRFDLPSYLFIAVFSYIFDYMMAYYLYKIISLLIGNTEKNKIIACISAAALIIPMVVANSAIWKQSDSIYVAIVLGGVYYFLKKKYNVAFILFGVAFSFKLQTILILPFLLIMYYVLKEFSILYFAWIPAVYMLAGLPAIICGKTITRTYGTYYRQTSMYGAMTVNSPGFYNLGLSEYMYHHVAMVITIMVFAFFVVAVSRKEVKWDGVKILYLLGWSVMTCFEFLPSMHERYDYLAIIVLTYIAIFFRKRIIPAVLIMHIVSACTYGKFLYALEVNYTVLSAFYLISYMLITYDFLSLLYGEEAKSIYSAGK